MLSDILDDPDQDLDTQMRSEPISRIMTPATTMAWVEPTTGVEQCIAMMKEHGLLFFVLDKSGSEIIGVISLKDILIIVQNGCESECGDGRRPGCDCCRPDAVRPLLRTDICPRCWAAEEMTGGSAPSAGSL